MKLEFVDDILLELNQFCWRLQITTGICNRLFIFHYWICRGHRGWTPRLNIKYEIGSWKYVTAPIPLQLSGFACNSLPPGRWWQGMNTETEYQVRNRKLEVRYCTYSLRLSGFAWNSLPPGLNNYNYKLPPHFDFSLILIILFTGL